MTTRIFDLYLFLLINVSRVYGGVAFTDARHTATQSVSLFVQSDLESRNLLRNNTDRSDLENSLSEYLVTFSEHVELSGAGNVYAEMTVGYPDLLGTLVQFMRRLKKEIFQPLMDTDIFI